MTRLDYDRVRREDMQRRAAVPGPTRKQVGLLVSLCEQLGLSYLAPETKDQASAQIGSLLEQARQQRSGGRRRAVASSRSTRASGRPGDLRL